MLELDSTLELSMEDAMHVETPTRTTDEFRGVSAAPTSQGPCFKRRLKNLSKRGLRGLFEFGQRLGVDVLPRHFYSEVPCIRELRRESHWRLPHSMVGVRGSDIDPQFEFVESCCSPHLIDRQRRGDLHWAACEANGEPGFGPIDTDFLHCFIRAIRPGKIVQVGCGVSTAVMLQAASEAGGYEPEVICVEPFPTEFLRRAAKRSRCS